MDTRTKVIVACAGLLLSIASTIPSAKAQNLLADPEFNSPLSTSTNVLGPPFVTGVWGPTSSTPPAITETGPDYGVVAASGSNFLGLYQSGSSGYTQAYQAVNIPSTPPGMTFNLSAEFNAPVVAGLNPEAVVTMDFYSNANSYNVGGQPLGTASDTLALSQTPIIGSSPPVQPWQTLNLTYADAPAGATYVVSHVGFLNSSLTYSGSSYPGFVDQPSLTESCNYNNNYVNTSGSAQASLDLIFNGNLVTAFSGQRAYYVSPSAGTNAVVGAIPLSTPGLSVSASYNPVMGTTTLVYSGSGVMIPSGGTVHVGYSLPPGMYLGGTSGTNSMENIQSPTFIGSWWNNSAGSLTAPTSALTMSLKGAPSLVGSGGLTYIILTATALTPGGSPATQWAEFPLPVNAPQLPLFENDSNVPITLSDVGFQLSNTMIPLDNLNFNDEPPSSFTPFSSIPNGTTLQPGGEIVAPEPGALALLGAAAAVGLLGYARRRRKFPSDGLPARL